MVYLDRVKFSSGLGFGLFAGSPFSQTLYPFLSVFLFVYLYRLYRMAIT